MGARSAWLKQLVHVIERLALLPSMFTLKLYLLFGKCTLFLGKRGGRKHAKDLTDEILSRLKQWENGEIAALWTSAVTFATTTEARRMSPLVFESHGGMGPVTLKAVQEIITSCIEAHGYENGICVHVAAFIFRIGAQYGAPVVDFCCGEDLP